MAKDKILKPFLGIISPENKFTVDTIDDLKSRTYLIANDIVEVLGYHSKGDKNHHKRIVSAVDDGTGEKLANGLYANILDEEIDLGWLGVRETDDASLVLEKLIKRASYPKTLLIKPNNKTYYLKSTINLTTGFNINFGNSTFRTILPANQSVFLINGEAWEVKMCNGYFRTSGTKHNLFEFKDNVQIKMCENMWFRDYDKVFYSNAHVYPYSRHVSAFGNSNFKANKCFDSNSFMYVIGNGGMTWFNVSTIEDLEAYRMADGNLFHFQNVRLINSINFKNVYTTGKALKENVDQQPQCCFYFENCRDANIKVEELYSEFVYPRTGVSKEESDEVFAKGKKLGSGLNYQAYEYNGHYYDTGDTSTKFTNKRRIGSSAHQAQVVLNKCERMNLEFDNMWNKFGPFLLIEGESNGGNKVTINNSFMDFGFYSFKVEPNMNMIRDNNVIPADSTAYRSNYIEVKDVKNNDYVKMLSSSNNKTIYKVVEQGTERKISYNPAQVEAWVLTPTALREQDLYYVDFVSGSKYALGTDFSGNALNLTGDEMMDLAMNSNSHKVTFRMRNTANIHITKNYNLTNKEIEFISTDDKQNLILDNCYWISDRSTLKIRVNQLQLISNTNECFFKNFSKIDIISKAFITADGSKDSLLTSTDNGVCELTIAGYPRVDSINKKVITGDSYLTRFKSFNMSGWRPENSVVLQWEGVWTGPSNHIQKGVMGNLYYDYTRNKLLIRVDDWSSGTLVESWSDSNGQIVINYSTQ